MPIMEFTVIPGATAPEAGVDPPDVDLVMSPLTPQATTHLRKIIGARARIAEEMLGVQGTLSPKAISAFLACELGILYDPHYVAKRVKEGKPPNPAWMAAFHAARTAGKAWSQCLADASAAVGGFPAGTEAVRIWNRQIALEKEIKSYFAGPPPYGFELGIVAGKRRVFDFGGNMPPATRGQVIEREARASFGLSLADAKAAGESAAYRLANPNARGALFNTAAVGKLSSGFRPRVLAQKFLPSPPASTLKKPATSYGPSYVRSTPPPTRQPSQSIVGPLVVTGVGAAGGGAAGYYLANHSTGWAVAGALGGALAANIIVGLAAFALASVGNAQPAQP